MTSSLKAIANFRPLRNQTMYVNHLLNLNNWIKSYGHLSETLAHFPWPLPKCGQITWHLLKILQKCFQNSDPQLNFRRTNENWCCYYVLLQSYERKLTWGGGGGGERENRLPPCEIRLTCAKISLFTLIQTKQFQKFKKRDISVVYIQNRAIFCSRSFLQLSCWLEMSWLEIKCP